MYTWYYNNEIDKSMMTGSDPNVTLDPCRTPQLSTTEAEAYPFPSLWTRLVYILSERISNMICSLEISPPIV